MIQHPERRAKDEDGDGHDDGPKNGSNGGANGHQVRYGVVGLGWFAQAAILPAFENAKKSSRLVALFSSDAEKLCRLGDEHGVRARFSYDRLEAAVRDEGIDALYIAVPNHLHRDFTVLAAEAGAHVLCEKPMAVTEKECDEMIRATSAAGVKLMIAYRLHFEEANLCAVRRVESGRIGDPRLFEAVFANCVADPDNIRLHPIDEGGGTLYDIGIYCLNAARYIFRSEPEEVVALSARGGRQRFADSDETTAAILRFPGGRIATFASTFGTADHDRYTVHGTEGSLRVEPAFQFRAALGHRLTVGERSCSVGFPERDQIAPEILHFSECILEDREPEPSGREGLADVRVIRALYRSAAEGRAIRLEPVAQQERPGLDQERRRPQVDEQELVHAEAPSAG